MKNQVAASLFLVSCLTTFSFADERPPQTFASALKEFKEGVRAGRGREHARRLEHAVHVLRRMAEKGTPYDPVEFWKLARHRYGNALSARRAVSRVLKMWKSEYLEAAGDEGKPFPGQQLEDMIRLMIWEFHDRYKDVEFATPDSEQPLEWWILLEVSDSHYRTFHRINKQAVNLYQTWRDEQELATAEP